MKVSTFPLRETHQFSNFICDFVEQKKTFSFLDDSYFSSEYSKKIIDSKQNFPEQNRNDLVEILIQQNSFLTNTEATFNNINKLRKSNCFTITTAHQPCLFTGPIYTIVKAVSAIKLAEKYKVDFPDFEFVPIFYIGSEDHDFEELNHINLFNKKIEWNSNQTGAVGSMKIDGIEKLIDELETLFQNEIKKDEIITLLKKCYQPEYSVAKAFRSLLHELLGQNGLVILDANEPKLKQKFTSIIEDELFNRNSFKLLNDENWLTNFEDNKLQITPREINLFYLENQVRERIIFENNKWKVNNTSLEFTKPELELLAKNNPEKFSPNVVLRALYQSTILPDIAFVGGGSEVTYWLQLKPIFDFYNLTFPQVFLRDSIFWMDENAEQKRIKWNFSIEDIFTDINILINNFTEKSGGLNIENELKLIQQKIMDLNEIIKQHDKTYESLSMAAATQITNQLENLQKKILQSDKKKLSDSIQQIQKWKEKLLPQNHLHERYDNFISYYLKYGNQFVETLMVHLNPLNKNLKVFTPNND